MEGGAGRIRRKFTSNQLVFWEGNLQLSQVETETCHWTGSAKTQSQFLVDCESVLYVRGGLNFCDGFGLGLLNLEQGITGGDLRLLGLL